MELTARLEALENRLISDGPSLGRRLSSRGLEIYRKNPQERLLIPPDLSSELRIAFYQRMKRYSFRLFLRDLLTREAAFCPDDLTRYCSSRVAQEYTRFLTTTSTVVLLEKDQYRINRPGVSSFGPTLEWFVAQMFQKEFACPAVFGVRFKETDVGGDYDVLTLWEGRLIYVEVKSSPPKSIEDPEVAAFFLRVNDLMPDIALFFNDTHLRMKDKVIQIFKHEMEKIQRRIGRTIPIGKLSDEIYQVGRRIYILNSKRDIVDNFRVCLRDHLRHGLGIEAFVAERP
jgi:hypothetical protein